MPTRDAVAGTVGIPANTAGKQTLTWTHTCAAGANRVYVIGSVGLAPDTNVTATDATYAGQAMTSLGKIHSNNGTSGFIEMFYLDNPPAGASAVTFSDTGGTIATLIGHSISYLDAGAHVFVDNAGANSPATITVASDVDHVVLAGFANGAAFTAAGGNGTELWHIDQDTQSAAGNSYGEENPGAASVTATATCVDDWFSAVAVDIAPGAATGTSYAVTGHADALSATTGRLQTPGPFDFPVAGTSAASSAASGKVGARFKLSGRVDAVSSTGKQITDNGLADTWFTDYHGNPQLLVNAEDWGVLPNGGDGDFTFDGYFGLRAGQGYNCWYGSWCSFTGLSGGANGADSDGELPFAGGMDPTTAPNETFWARRDSFIAAAAANGFRVILNLTTPYLHHTAPNTPPQRTWTNAQWDAFAAFVGNRYKDATNVMWMVGDDYYDDINPQLDRLLAGLRAAGANQPISIQYFQGGSSRYADGVARAWGSNAQYEWGYTYTPWYTVSEDMGDEPSPIPYFAADGFFLNEEGHSPLTDVQLLRRHILWALSSGSKGFTTGDADVWPWYPTSMGQLTAKSFYTTDVPALVAFFAALPNWHLLKADTSSQLVTAGRGTRWNGPDDAFYGDGSAAGGAADSDNYVSAARTPDGTLAVIYMSKGSTITVDESKMLPGYKATWVDPKTLATTPATAGATYNSTTLGNNADGLDEWLLVLQGVRVTGKTAASSGTSGKVTVNRAASGKVDSTSDTTGAVGATYRTSGTTNSISGASGKVHMPGDVVRDIRIIAVDPPSSSLSVDPPTGGVLKADEPFSALSTVEPSVPLTTTEPAEV